MGPDGGSILFCDVVNKLFSKNTLVFNWLSVAKRSTGLKSVPSFAPVIDGTKSGFQLVLLRVSGCCAEL